MTAPAVVMHLVPLAGPGPAPARPQGPAFAECPCCRRVYDPGEWVALPFVVALPGDADHETLVVRECACRSSFGVFVVEAARCAAGGAT